MSRSDHNQWVKKARTQTETAMSVATSVNGAKPVVVNRLSGIGLPKPAAERKVITPAEAKAILERSQTNNRKLVGWKVKMFAQAMRLGKWQYNGQTISFDQAGNLLNGHHRLYACIEADTPFETLVAYNVDPASMPTTDTGTSRSATHVLQIAGHKNAADKGSLLRVVWHWETGTLHAVGNGTKEDYTHEVMLEVADRHPNLDDDIRTAMSFYGQFRACSRVLFGFALACLSAYDRELAVDFCEKLASGENLSRNHPVAMLRKRLIDDQANKAKLPMRDKLALLIKAWRAYVAGNELRVLKWMTTEEFPNPDPMN